MQTILAIDPGPTHSGYVVCCPEHPTHPIDVAGHVENYELLSIISAASLEAHCCIIEDFVARGQPCGHEAVNTCKWIGRFSQKWFDDSDNEYSDAILLSRPAVCQFLTGNIRAKKPEILVYLIGRYGGSRKVAVGTKHDPGPLYGLNVHTRDAFALALAYHDGLRPKTS